MNNQKKRNTTSHVTIVFVFLLGNKMCLVNLFDCCKKCQHIFVHWRVSIYEDTSSTVHMGVKCAKDHSCLHFKIVEHEFLGNQTETCVAFTLHLHSHSLSSVSVTTLPDV